MCSFRNNNNKKKGTACSNTVLVSHVWAEGFMMDGRQVVFHRHVRVSLSEWGLQFKWEALYPSFSSLPSVSAATEGASSFVQCALSPGASGTSCLPISVFQVCFKLIRNKLSDILIIGLFQGHLNIYLWSNYKFMPSGEEGKINTQRVHNSKNVNVIELQDFSRAARYI